MVSRGTRFASYPPNTIGVPTATVAAWPLRGSASVGAGLTLYVPSSITAT